MRVAHFILLFLFASTGCQSGNTTTATPVLLPDSLIHPEGKTIRTRIAPPTGYVRDSFTAESFAAYLQNLPLRPHGAVVRTYKGAELPKPGVYCAVLDIDVGKEDLQQCADAIIRLRAEYLWSQKRYDAIRFNFTNGFPAEYRRWRNGERIRVNGNKTNWSGGGEASGAYAVFRQYLTMVFRYAGTQSLARELQRRPDTSAFQCGDVIIKGGSPGHAVIAADAARDPHTGERLVLFVQSYMPAQEIQVLNNPAEPDISPWYRVKTTGDLRTPEWDFDWEKDRRKF
jgi:Domain of unknown function (4846)